MEDEHEHRTKWVASVGILLYMGGFFTFWFMCWLFTIAFANLVWWKMILALIVWPYFLGLALR